MTAKSATAVAATTGSTRGQSQWALIWRAFCKRRMAVCAAVVILVLITTSVFAPILANAAPLYYFGYNRFEYQEAGRTLRATITQLIESRTSDQSKIDAQRLLKTLPIQIGIMADAIAPDKAAPLRTIGQDLLSAAVIPDQAKSIEELKRLQRDLRANFDAKDLTLVSKSHFPVFQSLNGLEVFFLCANILFLLLPVWKRLLRVLFSADHEDRRKWGLVVILIVIPTLAGGLRWWMVPSRVDRTDYKNGVFAADSTADRAPVVYESVTWPLIVYSLDEYDLSGKSAAPAWYPAAWCPTGKDAASMKPTSTWSGPHWLGTDEAGRDVLCRIIWGGRVSLSVGLVAVAIYVAIGIVVGAIAGYFRGVPDLVISRLIEVMICFPTFFLILTIVAFFGPSIMNIMVIIGLTGWTGIARLVRGEFLRLVDQEFVLAGRALGYSPIRIIFRHVLPNAMAPVLVSATFGIAGAILTESALSFLGLGISKPTPSWGGLLADGREALLHAPWLIHFPGLAIFITITAYNLMGEALRDASDPRLRGSR
ncbi:ABC transporter permease [Schlesneria paludicola]|uniref:ABC transporter permease n=1 Tax=Schlesneria paludicola TaxID=360056 RepID=UPI00138ADCE2|nr:ABC transporter permease [Schlesneria paludicola]